MRFVCRDFWYRNYGLAALEDFVVVSILNYVNYIEILGILPISITYEVKSHVASHGIRTVRFILVTT